MTHLRNNAWRAGLSGWLVLALAPMLVACNPAPDTAPTQPPVATAPRDRPALGLMTSLPLYWPLGAGVAEIASGTAAPPWQRAAIEGRYALVPLDTLSPIASLAPDAPDTDPLAGLDLLAVIQPRGLSPADNASLDAWVRGGGRLLLVLDPALTGDYDLPLGDPRRPVDTALIPPVAARWGLAVSFDEAQAAQVTTASLGKMPLPLALTGRAAITDPAAADCTLLAQGAAATCRVGAGQVTLIADAAVFEHRELAGEGGGALLGVLAAAFAQGFGDDAG